MAFLHTSKWAHLPVPCGDSTGHHIAGKGTAWATKQWTRALEVLRSVLTSKENSRKQSFPVPCCGFLLSVPKNCPLLVSPRCKMAPVVAHPPPGGGEDLLVNICTAQEPCCYLSHRAPNTTREQIIFVHNQHPIPLSPDLRILFGE